MKIIACVLLVLVFLTGCALLMNPPQREAFGNLTEELDAVETEISGTVDEHERGELTTEEFEERLKALWARRDAIKARIDELIALSPKWYQVLFGFLAYFMGKSYVRGLIIRRTIGGVEDADDLEVKEAIAAKSNKGFFGFLVSRLLDSWVQKVTG